MLHKKYVADFAQISWEQAVENYCILAGYKKNTRRIPLTDIKALFDAITSVIPDAASSTNQLTDKNYVDQSVEQVAAKYLSADANGNPFSSYSSFIKGPYYYAGQKVSPTKNDYCLVNGDETHNNAVTRYWYTGSSWSFQYVVNNSALTPEQMAALNSTITAAKVSLYDSHINNGSIHVSSDEKVSWDAKYDKPDSGIPEEDLSQDVQNKLNSSGDAYIKPDGGIPSSDMTQAVQTSLEKADNSVQQVSGKGLSTNDFTNEDKSKLDGIEAGAEVNETLEHDDYVTLSKAGNTTTIGISVHTGTYDI